MSKLIGRKAAPKTWDTGYRHSFYTSYGEAPDLHTLMFISGANMNAVIREALRDYMVKHNSPALDPEFRRKLYLIASEKTAAGHAPIASEVLVEMGLELPYLAHAEPARRPALSPQPKHQLFLHRWKFFSSPRHRQRSRLPNTLGTPPLLLLRHLPPVLLQSLMLPPPRNPPSLGSSTSALPRMRSTWDSRKRSTPNPRSLRSSGGWPDTHKGVT